MGVLAPDASHLRGWTYAPAYASLAEDAQKGRRTRPASSTLEGVKTRLGGPAGPQDGVLSPSEALEAVSGLREMLSGDFRTRLNLGCGRDVRPGWVNADRSRIRGAVVADAAALPFPDAVFDLVEARHSLEHVDDLPAAMREIRRVLLPGGLLVAVVPYGLSSLYNPFHRRAFSERSMAPFCGEDSCLDSERLFALLSARVTDHGYPLKWHLRRYLGVQDLPLGTRREISFRLVRA